jgi:hypothetical protein
VVKAWSAREDSVFSSNMPCKESELNTASGDFQRRLPLDLYLKEIAFSATCILGVSFVNWDIFLTLPVVLSEVF